MNEKKVYFFPPQWDFDHNGPIRLGNVITDPRSPQYAFNIEEHVPLSPISKKRRISRFRAKITANPTQSAELLSLFGLAAGVTFGCNTTEDYTVEAESLLTQEIEPSPAFARTCFEQKAVRRHLAENGYKDVYMVTGIMTASRATVIGRETVQTLFESRSGVSGSAAGNDLGLDANTQTEGQGCAEEEEQEEETDNSNFVLAYRLRKITYLKVERMKSREDVRWKGTVLIGYSKPEQQEVEYSPEFVRLEDGEMGPAEFDLDSVQTTDEEQRDEFEFVIPLDRQPCRESEPKPGLEQ